MYEEDEEDETLQGQGAARFAHFLSERTAAKLLPRWLIYTPSFFPKNDNALDGRGPLGGQFRIFVLF